MIIELDGTDVVCRIDCEANSWYHAELFNSLDM